MGELRTRQMVANPTVESNSLGLVSVYKLCGRSCRGNGVMIRDSAETGFKQSALQSCNRLDPVTNLDKRVRVDEIYLVQHDNIRLFKLRLNDRVILTKHTSSIDDGYNPPSSTLPRKRVIEPAGQSPEEPQALLILSI